MDKIKLKRIIGKQNKAVSPVIATIIMVCLVVAIIAPLVFMMNSTIKEPDIEGFWSLLNNGLPDTDDTDTSEEGTIIGGLACPCDLLIINDNAKIGYAKNRILCTEMEKASLLSDDGEEERYSIEVRSNEVDNLIYQVTCFDDGNYTFTVEYTTSKETRSVAANDINVNEYEVHKYQINWISRPPTITLWIDKEGDGNFEIEITKETDTITNEIIGDAKEPITIELNDPIMDGTVSSDGFMHDNTNNVLFTGIFYGVFRSYIEWDISSIPDTATINNVVFKYHGKQKWENFGDCHIHEMLGTRPSISSTQDIFDEAGEGTVYADPDGFPVIAENQQLDLGSSAESDLQSQLASDWFAIGIQVDDELTHFAEIYAEDYVSANPAPTLEITYTDAKESDDDDDDINDAPVANDDWYETDEDTLLIVGAPGVLGNDTDIDGPLALSAVLDIGVSHGTLTLNSDGSFDYKPDTDWNGIDTFTYKAYDGEDYSGIATVTIDVDPAGDDDEGVPEGKAQVVIELANVINPTTRCIKFDMNGCGSPTTHQELSFVDHDSDDTTPVRYEGLIDIPEGTWDEICVKDEQHTLYTTVGLSERVATEIIVLLPGDTDNDGDVDNNDITWLIYQYGKPAADGGCPWDGTRDADFNNDGIVDEADRQILAGNWLAWTSCECCGDREPPASPIE